MAKPGSEMTHVERQAAHERNASYDDVVFDMAMRGESQRKIAAATGIPQSSVNGMIKRLQAQYVDDRYGDRNAVLGRELAILDSLTRTNLKRAQDGNKDAAAIVLQSSRERRRLLGLDSALKADVTVKTPLDVEIERLVALLAPTTGDGVPAE